MPAFTDAYQFLLRGDTQWRGEQGYAAPRASDPNPTLDGITQHTYDAHRSALGLPPLPVRDMPDDEREAIYRDYWHAASCDDVAAFSPRIALAHFVYYVNRPPAKALALLQRIAGVAPDGRIGPTTLAAIRASDERAFLIRYLGGCAAEYKALAAKRPDLAPNLNGWLLRVSATQRRVGVS